MRIFGSNATARVAAPQATKRAASGGFALAETDAPQATHAAASLRTIGSIDALMALQGQDEPAERQRAVKRGRTALDALDELKLELLSGTLEPSTLLRLKSATAELRDASGDATLDAVLAEIELRVAVEIAKMTPADLRIRPFLRGFSGAFIPRLSVDGRRHISAPRAGRLVCTGWGRNEEEWAQWRP